MEATGKIVAVMPIRGGISQRTGNQWASQSFVLETQDQYPKHIPFDVFGAEKISTYNIQMGDELTIQFDVDGREWEGKWFPKITCFGVKRTVQQTAPAPQSYAKQPQQEATRHEAPKEAGTAAGGDNDDLPF